MSENRILFIGCGKMGGSLLKGILRSDEFLKKIDIVEPNPQKLLLDLVESEDINIYQDIKEIMTFDYNTYLIATKPQIHEKIFSQLKDKISGNNDLLIISILAGVTTLKIKNLLGDLPIVRTMPNLAVSEASGMSALFANRHVNSKDKKTSSIIFGSVGEYIWVKDEEILDVITAISGSGPAYYFYLTECLCKIAVELGIDKESALLIARQVAIGSGDIIRASKDSPLILRKNVTSKGGTTEAAFKQIINENEDFYNILMNAVKNAIKKSHELS